MQTILIADDEANIRDLARLYLEKEGYRTITVNDGAAALRQIQMAPPDLLVLDLMMPEMDGWEVCRRLQADVVDVPILILTARDDDIDKIVLLEMGADDYVTKPFNPRVLVARVRAILRRAGKDSAETHTTTITIGDLTLMPEQRHLTIDGQRVELRAKEYDLLMMLARHPNIVLSRDRILSEVWGYDYYGKTRTVDVHIGQLREKISPSNVTIETVWGVGYRLTPPD